MLRKKLEGYEGAAPLSKTVSVFKVSTPSSPSIDEDEEKEHDEDPVVPINTDLMRDGFEFVDRPRIEATSAALDPYDAPVYEEGDDDKTTVVGDDGDVAAEAFVRDDDESTEVDDDDDVPTLAPTLAHTLASKPSLSVFYSRKVDPKRKRDDDEVAAEPASKKMKVLTRWLLKCPCGYTHKYKDNNKELERHRDACFQIYRRKGQSDEFHKKKFRQSHTDPEQATRNGKLWEGFECRTY